MEMANISPFARFVRHLEIEADSAFPKYIPLDSRLFYVLKGESKIKLGEEEVCVKSGGLIFVNAGCPYQLLPCDTVYLAVNFDFTSSNSNIEAPVPPENATNLRNVSLIEKSIFTDALCFNEYCVLDDCRSLKSKLLRLEDEYIKKLPFYKKESSAILISILTYIARKAEERPPKEGRFDIVSVLTYINDHYNEPLTNSALAEIFHFHPNYISSEFKRYTGKPLHKYVLETRILNAVSLIESGYNDISKISNLTGFSDTNYFSRYFKRIIGTSPGRYIRNCSTKSANNVT